MTFSIPARYDAGTCHLCEEKIMRGEMIVGEERTWVHQSCANDETLSVRQRREYMKDETMERLNRKSAKASICSTCYMTKPCDGD